MKKDSTIFDRTFWYVYLVSTVTMLQTMALPSNFPFILLESSNSRADQAGQLHGYSLKTGNLNHPLVSSKLLSLYTSHAINNLSYARSVFDHIQRPSLVCWNLLIKAYVDNHQSQTALILFNHLVSDSSELKLDNFTLPCVIKGCARLGAVEEGKQVHGLALKIGLADDAFVDGSLVSMYSKVGDILSAKRVFDRMGNKDLVCWNALMDGYVKRGEIEIARKLFEEMPDRDVVSWTILIDGYSRCGKVYDAREMFDTMPSRNLTSWNVMINGYMKSGDSGSARKLFDLMTEKNLITWNSMIAGYEFNQRYLEALEMFLMMLEIGAVPNHATLVSVFAAISGLALVGMGRWAHSYMLKNCSGTDGVAGISLIDMYSKCGCIDDAFKVFNTITNKKAGHWTAIIVGLGLHGMAKDALKVFHEMCSTGITPNDITFLGILNACSHAGFVEEGRNCFNMMQSEYGIEPTAEHYGCLVDLLCRAGHLDMAKDTIEKMPIRPNKIIWMSLLSGARNYRRIDIGEFAAKHVMDLSPDTVGCYILLSNMYARAGLWDKVAEVREMMNKQGVKKDPGCSSIEHEGMVHEFTVGNKSHPQTEAIYLKLTEMREKLNSRGHAPDTTQVLLCIDGQKEKEAELENHSERLAIAFGLINVRPGKPIRIIKNLRVCNDCHAVFRMLSGIYEREIIVRDNSRFHHFKKGSCSCMDYW